MPKPTITHTICGYCSTGCGLSIHQLETGEMKIRPRAGYPVNNGSLCPKGAKLFEPFMAPDRAVSPMRRENDGSMTSLSWDESLEEMCTRFKQIIHDHGPEAVAFLSTGQITTEEFALLGALTKYGMGILDGDGNTRQCMASSVVAYKQAFGFDAPPYCYADFEESDLIILVGSNMAITQPIMWRRTRKNSHNSKIITIDPRASQTATKSDVHYQIKPKTDLFLFYGIARRLIVKGWVDDDFVQNNTKGFTEFAQFVRDFNLEMVSVETGLSVPEIKELTRLIHEHKRVSFWWAMGINQSYQGVRGGQSLINLALMTGNIGRPGTGANSVTGQCNAMGSRLFSNLSNMYGGRDFTNPKQRAELAKILDIDEKLIPTRPSKPYNQIVESIADGTIKGLWVIATNPASSWINQSDFLATLKKLDYLVVQDMYTTTATAKYADLILPAAGSAEKTGTFINSERRIGVLNSPISPPGLALSDFDIFLKIADKWGCADLLKKWQTPAAVFEILKETSRGTVCDISGIRDYAMLDAENGIQWPYPENNPDTTKQRRLFADKTFYHDDGKARFCFAPVAPVPEPTDAMWPLWLLTGRGTIFHWHTRTKTGKIEAFNRQYSKQPYILIHPDDATKYGVEQEKMITVVSRHGRGRFQAKWSETMAPGQIFISMHYQVTNQLTGPYFDPLSFQPSYKATAVRIEKE